MDTTVKKKLSYDTNIGGNPKNKKLRESVHFQKMYEAEKVLLKHSGLILDKDLFVYDVPLHDEEDNFIHTITCGDRYNPPLLIVHGYGGTANMFYLMLKDLAK